MVRITPFGGMMVKYTLVCLAGSSIKWNNMELDSIKFHTFES
jgi:hypothetical protein